MDRGSALPGKGTTIEETDRDETFRGATDLEWGRAGAGCADAGVTVAWATFLSPASRGRCTAELALRARAAGTACIDDVVFNCK